LATLAPPTAPVPVSTPLLTLTLEVIEPVTASTPALTLVGPA